MGEGVLYTILKISQKSQTQSDHCSFCKKSFTGIKSVDMSHLMWSDYILCWVPFLIRLLECKQAYRNIRFRYCSLQNWCLFSGHEKYLANI